MAYLKSFADYHYLIFDKIEYLNHYKIMAFLKGGTQ